VMPYVGAEPDDVRQAYVFPPRRAGHSTFTLVEDDGVTFDYQRGVVTRVSLHITAYNDALDFAVQARGNFPLAYTHVEFIVPRTETRALQTCGDVWTDAEGRRHVLVKVEGLE